MNALGLGLVAWFALAWLTHVVACIQSASWALLFIGSFIFPIAWVHGTGIWLGMF